MALLSVIVPTFNEADHIVAFLADLETAVTGVDYEIVTVDDNSPDGTHQRILDHGRENPRIRPLLRTTQRGLATAVIAGMAAATGEFLVVMDSDYQHPPRDVPRLLAAARNEDADLVIGSRFARGGSQAGFTWHRRLVSWGAKVLAFLALPAVRRFSIRDPQSGFFLVRRDCLPVGRLRPRGYKILLEVLARSHLDRVVEVGYAFESRRGGQSKLGLKVQWDYLMHLAGLAWADADNRRLMKFTFVGATGVIVNLALLTFLMEVLGLRDLWTREVRGFVLFLGPLAAAVASREGAILWNFVWNDAITFHHIRHHTHGGYPHRMFRFHVVSLASALVYLAIFYPLYHLVPAFQSGLTYLVPATIAIALSFLFNYVGNVRWTYARRKGTHD